MVLMTSNHRIVIVVLWVLFQNILRGLTIFYISKGQVLPSFNTLFVCKIHVKLCSAGIQSRIDVNPNRNLRVSALACY